MWKSVLICGELIHTPSEITQNPVFSILLSLFSFSFLTPFICFISLIYNILILLLI